MAEKEKNIEAEKVSAEVNAAQDEAEVSEVREIKETRYDDGVNISPEISAPEAGSAAEAKKTGAGGDITAATLVHLLGIPNKNEFKILEKKMDLVLNRLNSLSTKFDTVVTGMSSDNLLATLTRIDEQLVVIQQKLDLKADSKK